MYIRHTHKENKENRLEDVPAEIIQDQKQTFEDYQD